MKILIDMDGVLVDFVGGVENVLGKPKTNAYYDIHKWYSMSANKFWKTIDTHEFWANLEWYAHAKVFYHKILNLNDNKDVYICTSPTLNPECASGKISWMKREFGNNFRNYIITPHKHLLANKTTVLIDDNDSNIEKFHVAGGRTILFPRPWNKLGPVIFNDFVNYNGCLVEIEEMLM